MRASKSSGPALICCAVVTSALLLAGCGAGSSPKSTADRALPTNNDAAGSAMQAAPNPAAKAPSAAQGKTTLTGVQIPASGQAISYTADLKVQAKDVTAAANQAKGYVLAAGGYVATETGSTDPASANLSFRVPAANYSTVLTQLTDKLGKRLSLQQNAQDKTQEVADVASRVKSAQATLDTFKRLLSKANTIGDVLNVEQEISTREADLESLQARQKALAQETLYSTITLAVEGMGTPPPAKKHHSQNGFAAGLSNGWDAFTALLSGLAAGLGWLLPFLILAVVVGVPALVVRRRLQTRRKPPAPDPAP
jgi:hypothetical protein